MSSCRWLRGVVLPAGLLLPLAGVGQGAPALRPGLTPFREADAWGLRPALWGYRDSVGTTVIKPQYHYAERFRRGYAVVGRRDSLGVITPSNQLVIPLRYQFIDYLGSDRFQFGYRKEYFGEYRVGCITAGNQVIIPPVFNLITLHANCLLVTATRDSAITEGRFAGARAKISTHGLYTLDGQELFPCQYDFITWQTDSLLVLTLHRRQALASRTGQLLTPFAYTTIGEFREGLASVRTPAAGGYLNRAGQLVISGIQGICEPFEQGRALIQVNGKWGAINTKGRRVVKPRFTYAEAKAKARF